MGAYPAAAREDRGGPGQPALHCDRLGRGLSLRAAAPMNRRTTKPSIRLWGGLALAIIIAVPALTTLGIYSGVTWWQQQSRQATLTAAMQAIGADAAQWRKPTWQARARLRLATLGV